MKRSPRTITFPEIGKRIDQHHLFAPNLKVGDTIVVIPSRTKDEPEEHARTFKAEKLYPEFVLCRITGIASYRACFRYFDLYRTPGYKVISN